MIQIGLAVTRKEFELITKKTYNSSNAYLIANWEGLDVLRDGTQVIVFSKEWFSSQEISGIDNLLPFHTFYRRAGIRVYYLDFYFDSESEEDLNGINEIIEREFYNILIGDGYLFGDILRKTSREMTRKDWDTWEDKVYKKEELPEDVSSMLKQEEINYDLKEFFEKRRERMAPFWVKWKKNIERKMNESQKGSTKEQKTETETPPKKKKKEVAQEESSGDDSTISTKSDESFNLEQIHNSESSSYSNASNQYQKAKEEEPFSWELLKKFYLKGLLCIVFGIVLGMVVIKPLMNNLVSSEAEALREPDNSMQDNSRQWDDDLVGFIKLPNKEGAIGVRLGTSNEILKKGAGLDESSATKLGEKGHALVYVYLEFEDLKKGDIVTVETMEGEFKYEVKETRVTRPENEIINRYTKKNKLTFITNYSPNQEGVIPECFVVEMELVEKEIYTN